MERCHSLLQWVVGLLGVDGVGGVAGEFPSTAKPLVVYSLYIYLYSSVHLISVHVVQLLPCFQLLLVLLDTCMHHFRL